MNENELDRCRRLLGVRPGVSRSDLERAFMNRNLEIIRDKNAAGSGRRRELEAEHEELRAAFAALGALTDRKTEPARAPGFTPGSSTRHAVADAAKIAPIGAEFDEPPALLSFDNWKVNTFVPPLLLGLAWLVSQSPFAFFLTAFHIWIHELGHAVPAWFSGKHALPLPIGFTLITPEYSPFVHWGLLSLFGLLLVAGIKERKIWAIIAAVAFAALQHIMTWRMPDHRQEFWYGAFGGLGGEFIISTLFMMSFYVRLPEKFRWEWCRYLFFFLGAFTLLSTWLRWVDVYRGIEEIPFGSMIGGEDDQNGDMNGLLNEYDWSKFKIRRTYYLLGQACWIVLALTWAFFALRLNRLLSLMFSGVPSEEADGPK